MTSNRVALQIIFWVLIIGITYSALVGFMDCIKALKVVVLNTFFYCIVFYANTLFFFPKYYDAKRYREYILFTAVVIIFASLVVTFFEIELLHDHKPQTPPLVSFLMRSLFWNLFMVMVGSIEKIQRRLNEHLILTREIQEDKLKMEMKLLKTQINPHFLFNALNNIYSLAYLKSDTAPTSIIKLSHMLRYVIEDCASESVPLASEVDYIENYLEFQKMKSPEIKNISFKFNNLDLSGRIAPLLFIPFLENSFKYSKIEDNPDAYVNIELKTENKRKVIFNVSNSFPLSGKAKSGAGTGLKNVKQRLSILYPDKHNLIVDEKTDAFHVTLEIDISENYI